MRSDWNFKTVIAYETLAAAIQAKEMSERVARQMQSEIDAWPFELLDVRWLRQRAIAAAAEADMIIVAAHGAQELPASVKNWIESGLRRKNPSPVALVALVDDYWIRLGKEPPLCAYLKRLAERGNATFFCNLEPCTGLEAIYSLPTRQVRAVPDIVPHRDEVLMSEAG